jgi:hypothetical protein
VGLDGRRLRQELRRCHRTAVHVSAATFAVDISEYGDTFVADAEVVEAAEAAEAARLRSAFSSARLPARTYASGRSL